MAHGFSLLELLTVLALTAILAAIGVLSHQALRPSLSLDAAARQVVMDLKIARIRAITDHASHRLLFADGSASYQWQRKNGAGYVDEGRSVALPDGTAIAHCSAAGHAIGFGPRGTAASFGTVTLRNARGETRAVIVDIAGQVRVQ